MNKVLYNFIIIIIMIIIIIILWLGKHIRISIVFNC